MTGYESKKAMAQDKITDEQGRPMTYWGGKAQPAQEPVAWMVYTLDGASVCVTDNPADFTPEHRALPLYTTPPQRPWVGLTDEERKPLIQQAMMYYGYNKEYWLQTSGAGFCLLVQAIEAKLKDKNNG